MFERLRLWLIGNSGLKQATKEAAREATREGLLEGIKQGMEDALNALDDMGATQPAPPPVAIESTNGHHAEPLTATELRGLRKADLLALAAERGIDADESWTVADIREQLVG